MAFCKAFAAKRAASGHIPPRRDGGAQARRQPHRRVDLADGSHIGCGAFVDTAGASGARSLAAKAGIAIPVYAKKRCVYTFVAATKVAPFPLLIDTSGVWCRPEGEGFICGYSPDDLDETDAGRISRSTGPCSTR